MWRVHGVRSVRARCMHDACTMRARCAHGACAVGARCVHGVRWVHGACAVRAGVLLVHEVLVGEAAEAAGEAQLLVACLSLHMALYSRGRQAWAWSLTPPLGHGHTVCVCVACGACMACAWRAHGRCTCTRTGIAAASYMRGALLVWQRSAPELHQLLGAAGFVSLTTLPTAGLFSVVVGVKPAAVTAGATGQPPPEARPTRKRPASPAAEARERTARKSELAGGPLAGSAPAPLE